MIDRLLSLIAPHTCLSCGSLGSLVCAPCVSEIHSDRDPICIGCGAYSDRGVCDQCSGEWPIERAIVIAERSGVLEAVINEFKFNRKRSVYRDVAHILAPLLPYGLDARIVPVPTIAAHIRQRGYDHTALVYRKLARLHKLTYSPLLHRYTSYVQHGATRRDRLRQAHGAFTLRGRIDPAVLYIVYDDVTTTGASLKEAVRQLRLNGAQRIWVLVVVRQPLKVPLDGRS